ncbi:MAG TPA: hypothetical protein VGK34_09900 [Armatimonadota bacterium]
MFHSEVGRSDEADYRRLRQTAGLGRVDMRNLCIFLTVTILSWVGWGLGARFGMMTAFTLSSIGSLVGVYVGWRIHRDYLS